MLWNGEPNPPNLRLGGHASLAPLATPMLADVEDSHKEYMGTVYSEPYLGGNLPGANSVEDVPLGLL